MALVLACLAANVSRAALDAADIERALRVARGSEPERGRFHAAYLLSVTEPFVERLDVITEYRRLVLIAEQRVVAGDWMFANGLRAAEEALRAWRNKLTVKARIRFHPLKAYVRIPDISIVIDEGAGQLLPRNLTSEPQHAPLVPPNESKTLIGVVVEAYFDASAVGQRRAPIILRGPDAEDVRKLVDFAQLK